MTTSGHVTHFHATSQKGVSPLYGVSLVRVSRTQNLVLERECRFDPDRRYSSASQSDRNYLTAQKSGVFKKGTFQKSPYTFSRGKRQFGTFSRNKTQDGAVITTFAGEVRP